MIKIDDINDILKKKNPEAIESVQKAYKLAEYAHQGVYRESGEPYIIHPLHVAKNVLDMEIYDTDSICAALLHDTVEDNEEITLEDITHLINKDTSELVDGVTKMRGLSFSSKEDLNNANTRKIINGFTKDVRISLIKLADRLHNMQTLEFKKPKKQRENAAETMELFVPLALSMGAYKIHNELEDLSLKYLEPDIYNRILEKRNIFQEKAKEYLTEMKYKISKILSEKDIPHEILFRMKNICNIYRHISKGYRMENIYDLFYLKVLVNEVNECYRSLNYVHSLYHPMNGKFKDYIYNQRTNYYQSLHTTVSTEEEKLTKIKIRTFDMDKVSAYGIPAYWNLNPNKNIEEIPLYKSKIDTQNEIRNKHQFAKKLIEIDKSFAENAEFIREIKDELLTEHVYVYKHNGDIIELPKGATALDFICAVYPELLSKVTGVIVNGKDSMVSQELNNNDIINIETDGFVDHTGWDQAVKTLNGKHKIYQLIKNTKNTNI